jgi:hypothetical protein
LPSSRGRYLLVPRPLGVTLFKGGNCHPQIVAPPDQRPRQYRIHDVGPVGNLGALFFGCDVGFDLLNGANKISQYLTEYSDLSYRTLARRLKTRLHVHLLVPSVLVRHIQGLDAEPGHTHRKPFANFGP